MTNARFPDTARLRKAQEFKQVFSKGRRQHDAYFTVVALGNDCLHPRIGLTVSKRAARLAVQRNRIKRLIRENFRLQQIELPAVDIVVMAKSKACDVDNKTLKDSLTKHWQRLQEAG